MSRLRVGVLVSGLGTNLQALITASKDERYPARVVIVCANRECQALEIAKRAGISRKVFSLGSFPDRKARDVAMARALREHGVELVVCAGYNTILEHAFTRQFLGRIINIHPSLLPEFAGTMDAIQMALDAGVARTGCTVHLVTDEVDSGPILGQVAVPVDPDDTFESLRARIQEQEHVLLPDIVRRLAGQPLPIPV